MPGGLKSPGGAEWSLVPPDDAPIVKPAKDTGPVSEEKTGPVVPALSSRPAGDRDGGTMPAWSGSGAHTALSSSGTLRTA